MYNKKKSCNYCKIENNEFQVEVQFNEYCKGVKLNL